MAADDKKGIAKPRSEAGCAVQSRAGDQSILTLTLTGSSQRFPVRNAAYTLEHLCKIQVAMVLDFLEVPRTLMQTAEFSIKLEEISITITSTTITAML
jgi:hypothetical protein